MQYSLTINNRELLIPSPEERSEPNSAPRLPPLNTFRYSSKYEREHLKSLSVEEILRLNPHSHKTNWNPSFNDSTNRGIVAFDTSYTRPRQPSNIFEPTYTGPQPSMLSSFSYISSSSTSAFSSLSSSLSSTPSLESSGVVFQRSNSSSSDVFSRSSSVSSNGASTSCVCQDCEPSKDSQHLSKAVPTIIQSSIIPPQPTRTTSMSSTTGNQQIRYEPVNIQPALYNSTKAVQRVIKSTATANNKHYNTKSKSSNTQTPVAFVSKPRSRRVQKHLTGKSSRQRVGPSCDMCRRKKIKCDAYIDVLEQDVDDAGIQYDKEDYTVMDESLIARFLSPSDVKQGFKLLFANGKLIKFRNCSFCEAKGLQAQFQRGFTKEDTVVHSVMDSINKKEKKRLV